MPGKFPVLERCLFRPPANNPRGFPLVDAVLSGWAERAFDADISRRLALAYDKYQHCGE